MRHWISNPDFWKSVSERSLATVAETFLAMAGATAFDVLHAPWQAIVGVSLGAGAIAVAKGVMAAEFGDRGTPSLLEGGK